MPPAKTGLIAGIVVSGFGLAPAYMAPLSSCRSPNHDATRSVRPMT